MNAVRIDKYFRINRASDRGCCNFQH